MEYLITRHGNTFVAHACVEGMVHDCLADEDGSHHGESDHPVAALRQLLKKEEEG